MLTGKNAHRQTHHSGLDVQPSLLIIGPMSLLKNICLILTITRPSSCASRLEPIQLSAEYTSQAANTPLWMDIESAHDDDWHHLLNDGGTTLDW